MDPAGLRESPRYDLNVENQSVRRASGEQPVDWALTRPISPADYPQICDWIRTPSALRRVSSDSADQLTPSVLQRWVSDATATLVAQSPGRRCLGFCTLSRNESPGLPADVIEICHAIVAPQWRGGWLFLRLLECAAERAGEFGAGAVVGRVSFENPRVARFLRLRGIRELVERPRWAASGFWWFWASTGATEDPTRWRSHA